MTVVKKSVAIHPLMDKYIRKTWALLIDAGYDATYSTALNFMLLGAIFEAIRDGGWSEESRRTVWSFIEDQKTIKELNLEDQLANLAEQVSVEVSAKRTVKVSKR